MSVWRGTIEYIDRTRSWGCRATTNPVIAASSAPRTPQSLVASWGGRYSQALGIDLSLGASAEIFKWFLAALLYGARISERIANRTYHQFRTANALDPRAILALGWDNLVVVLDRGGYARYDYKTATKLQNVCTALCADYHCDLNTLQRAAASPADLEQRVRRLGKGIGPVTINIFLRELRGVWPTAQPLPATNVLTAAQALGWLPAGKIVPQLALELLQRQWADTGGSSQAFADFEAALLRYGRQLRRRPRPPHTSH